MSLMDAMGGPANAELISLYSRKDTKDDNRVRVPHPSHRHAAPSAPWPWVDLEDDVDHEQLNNPAPPIPEFCPHDASCNNCWTGYPQSRFPNWTYNQVVKSKIQKAIISYNKDEPCTLHCVDIDSRGIFRDVEPIRAKYGEESEVWRELIHDERPVGLRLRAFFIQNMSGPILQMLGTKYNVEPSFWSSSLNWIPSRSQEEIQPGIGDHITITMTFLRSMSNRDAIAAFNKSTDSLNTPSILSGNKIDTQAPLVLHSSAEPLARVLHLDQISVHLIRNINGSTIISYHPAMNLPTTTAKFFHSRILFAGHSVYWQTIFQKSPDPTFIFLPFMWHALYGWDESLENLYSHICYIESRVLHIADVRLTHELYTIRAHHMHYTTLLDDYQNDVRFIMDTTNPMQDNLSPADTKFSQETLRKECDNLLVQVSKLKNRLSMHERRLENIMGMLFSGIHLETSRHMGELTATAIRDSRENTAMKQIAYLTMTFLPGSFVAAIFGMNVIEINPGTTGTLTMYIAISLPLTLLIVWIAGFTSASSEGVSIFKQVIWPVYFVIDIIKKWRKPKNSDSYLHMV